MHRDDMVNVEIDQSLDGLPDIVLVVRRQMETSDDRVDFLQARHRHRLLHRVHHAAVPAGVVTTSPRPLTLTQVEISWSNSSGAQSIGRRSAGILSGKQPRPLSIPTFIRVGDSTRSNVARGM